MDRKEPHWIKRAIALLVFLSALLPGCAHRPYERVLLKPGDDIMTAVEAGDTSRFLSVETRLTDDECLCPERAFEVIFTSGENRITSKSKLWMLLGKHERVRTVYLHDGIIDKPSELNWTGSSLTLHDDNSLRTIQLGTIDSLAIRGNHWHANTATIGWILIGLSVGLVLAAIG
jgi:hypothetical protein